MLPPLFMKIHVVIASFITVVFSHIPVAYAYYFTDVPTGIWYENDLNLAVGKGWLSGYKDAQGNDMHRFGPQDLVTVGQALKIAQLAADRASSTPACDGCHWAEPYRSEAKGDHITLNLKNLDRFITRSEAAAMVGNAFRLDQYHEINQKGGFGTSAGIRESTCEYFSPFSDVPMNFRLCAIIKHLQLANVIHGDDAPEGKPRRFRPHDEISRAEFVRIALNGWAAFSHESPYVTLKGPRIEKDGIIAEKIYKAYQGADFSVQNNSSAQASISFSPTFWPDNDPWQIIEAGSQIGFNLREQVPPGTYQFTVKSGGGTFEGTLFVQPDPLQRKW